MAKKTVVKQLSKWLPLSAEFTAASQLDGSVRTDIGELVDVAPNYIDGSVEDTEWADPTPEQPEVPEPGK
jgi:recombination protein RecT